LMVFGPRFELRWRLVVLGIAVILVGAAVACDTYVNPINISPVVSGTPSGNYKITVVGTLAGNSKVVRTTTVNLTVNP